jgi:hypothetical protein
MGSHEMYIDKLNEDITRLTAELAEVKDRARRAAQILIEEIGAPGPENVDETATRAVATITRLTAENAALREYVEIITDGGTDYPETWDELHRLGLIVEVKPTPEFTEEWGEDVAMWVLAWKAGGFEAIDAASKS